MPPPRIRTARPTSSAIVPADRPSRGGLAAPGRRPAGRTGRRPAPRGVADGAAWRSGIGFGRATPTRWAGVTRGTLRRRSGDLARHGRVALVRVVVVGRGGGACGFRIRIRGRDRALPQRRRQPALRRRPRCRSPAPHRPPPAQRRRRSARAPRRPRAAGRSGRRRRRRSRADPRARSRRDRAAGRGRCRWWRDRPRRARRARSPARPRRPARPAARASRPGGAAARSPPFAAAVPGIGRRAARDGGGRLRHDALLELARTLRRTARPFAQALQLAGLREVQQREHGQAEEGGDADIGAVLLDLVLDGEREPDHGDESMILGAGGR